MAHKTVEIGTTFSAQHADSVSLYTVTAKRGADTYDCEIKAHPEHGTQIDWLGHKKVFGGEEIRAAIAHAGMLERMFAAADDFWATRRVGEILHYHDGFGQFVRGEVIRTDRGMQMLPTALVGDWTALPMRGIDGEVKVPYHVRKIREGISWAPNEGMVYESKAFTRHDVRDPRKMAEIDISDPAPLQGMAAEMARYEKLRMDLTGVLSNGYNDPRAALETAARMIADAGIK